MFLVETFPSPPKPLSHLLLIDAFLALFRQGLVLLRSISFVTNPLPQGGEPLAGSASLGMRLPNRLLADGKRGGRVRALPGGVPTAPDI